MTEQTEKLIYEFCKTKEICNLPGIFIGMQEEDNVADNCEMNNCFRALRNIAAHEPNTMTTALLEERNKGCRKLVFVTDTMGKTLNVDLVQFVMWMLTMYKKTNNINYVEFTHSFLQLMCPMALYKYNAPNVSPYVAKQHPGGVALVKRWIISEFLCIQKVMYETVGITKTVHTLDSYMQEALDEDERKFWKMAIPNMMEFICFMFSSLSAYNKLSNIELLLVIYDKWR